jgi:hypothetical protein
VKGGTHVDASERTCPFAVRQVALTGAELDSLVKQGIVAATCPVVRMRRTGFPRESTAMLILLLRPPPERPIASSSLPPFERRLHEGASAQ